MKLKEFFPIKMGHLGKNQRKIQSLDPNRPKELRMVLMYQVMQMELGATIFQALKTACWKKTTGFEKAWTRMGVLGKENMLLKNCTGIPKIMTV